MELLFRALGEERPGEVWSGLFQRHWPAYEHWFLSEGIEARPTYRDCVRALKKHLPEILPTYERLCGLAGGGDMAARFLSLYKPPAYITGCSQVVWPGDETVLIRNYDYSPALCEGVILASRWNQKSVLAMVDCTWGALDGVNEDGLAVSLTFGGRRVSGEGFGIPLIVRYILEFCSDVKDAAEVLARVPSHMAYNVTAADRTGAFVTALLAPDRKPTLSKLPIAANHQVHIDWHGFARATSTLERERFLFFRLQDKGMTPDLLTQHFLEPPLYTTAYGRGFGTVYTAAYRPETCEARYIWPGFEWVQSIGNFKPGEHRQRFTPDAGLQGVAVF